jgi:hypothetical protein
VCPFTYVSGLYRIYTYPAVRTYVQSLNKQYRRYSLSAVNDIYAFVSNLNDTTITIQSNVVVFFVVVVVVI